MIDTSPNFIATALPLLLTARQTARLLRISERSLWRMESEGTMPAPVKLIGTRWIRREIDLWTRDHMPSLANDRLRYRCTTTGRFESGPTLITVDELAALLGISRRSVYRLDLRGELPPALRVRGVRWIRQEIEAWLDQGCPVRENDSPGSGTKRAS